MEATATATREMSNYDSQKEWFFKIRTLREGVDTHDIWVELEKLEKLRKELELKEKKLRTSLIIIGNNLLRREYNEKRRS